MQKKKNLYRKSRYYRRRQQLLRRIYAAIGGVLLLVVIVLIVRGCMSRQAKTADSSNVKNESAANANTTSDTQAAASSTADSETSANGESENSDSAAGTAKASHDTPVTLTVSVVGDCTLGTDENFDYDTSLNAYFESYGKEYFFQNVKSIFEADDLTIANNEGTFTESYDREDKTFAFKAPASFAGILLL